MTADVSHSITSRWSPNVHVVVDGEAENFRVVLRNGAGRFLEVTRLPDGSLRIHGHDIGGGAEIFGSDDYEWFKTIPVSNLDRCREVLEVPEGHDILDHVERHFSDDNGYRFERLVRDHELAERFWSWP